MKITAETQQNFNALIEIACQLAQALVNEIQQAKIHSFDQLRNNYLRASIASKEMNALIKKYQQALILFDADLYTSMDINKLHNDFIEGLVLNEDQGVFQYDIQLLIKKLNAQSSVDFKYTNTSLAPSALISPEVKKIPKAAETIKPTIITKIVSAPPTTKVPTQPKTNYAFLLEFLANPYTQGVLAVCVIAGLAVAMISLGALTGPAGWSHVAYATAALLNTTPAILGIAGAVVGLIAGGFVGFNLFETGQKENANTQKQNNSLSITATSKDDTFLFSVKTEFKNEPSRNQEFITEISDFYDENSIMPLIDLIDMNLFQPFLKEYPDPDTQFGPYTANYDFNFGIRSFGGYNDKNITKNYLEIFVIELKQQLVFANTTNLTLGRVLSSSKRGPS